MGEGVLEVVVKKKIFLYYVILIVISLSFTGFFTSELTQKFYLHEVEEKLKNTARLIQYQLSKDACAGIKVDYNKKAVEYARILDESKPANTPVGNMNTRITFIDFGGNVLGESETNYLGMENHLDRQEVQEAIQGKIGEAIRNSKTLKIDYLYVAVPMKDAGVILRVSVPLVQVRKINETIWCYTIIGIIAGILLTVLLALRFSHSITRPIIELISISREISLGNYSKRASVKSRDELGQLAKTFNEMASKLENTINELRDKNIKVDSIMNSMTSGIVAVDPKFRIILINSIMCEMFGIKYGPGMLGMNMLELIRNNQLNALLKDTIEKNASFAGELIIGPPQNKIYRVHASPIKSNGGMNINLGGIASILDITNLKKLEQMRTEFVSNVTHELKTPLTSIRGFIETLRGGAIDDREVADKFLEIIDIEAERLNMLISDILQLSEIESKQKDTNIATHNLKPIVKEVFSILQGLADKKNVRLLSEIDENVKITANRDRIKQMLINLVDNGIKYNVDSGSVSVKAGRVEGKVIIIVRDTGIGISQEHLPRIFERFYRVDKGRSRSMGGTGLGLSIVKHIVNLYNGDIRVSSEPGKGTEFIIQLPISLSLPLTLSSHLQCPIS